jgi:S-DNA-T family DNA segregation ATPase FtsK/SpoIIIE
MDCCKDVKFSALVNMTKRKKQTKDISDAINVARIIKVNPLVLGTLFLTSALLIFLSIVSYNRLDLTHWSSVRDIFAGIPKHNWLGILGANIGKAFFEYTLGFPSLVFPLWLGYVGYRLVSKAREHVFYHPFFTFLIQLFFILSICFALPEAIRQLGRSRDYFPSGLIGGLTADVLVRLFGKWGSLVPLVCYTLGLFFIYFPTWFKSLKLPSFSNLNFRLPKITIDKSDNDDLVDATHEEDEKEKSVVIYESSNESFSNESALDIPEAQETDLDLNIAFTRQIDEKKEALAVEKKEETRPNLAEIETSQVNEPELPKDTDDALSFDDIDKISAEYFDDAFYEEDLNETIVETPKEQKPTVEKVEKAEAQPDSLEEESAEEEPAFTIEEAIIEKQANLDKTHKKMSKRERYIFPSVDILSDIPEDDVEVSEEELWRNAQLLEDKLQDFKVDAKVVNVVAGPVITMFELRPAQGVRVSKIESLMPDIALNMSARGIRYLGQLPAKDTIGIEIPNAHPKMVYFKDILNSEKFVKSKDELPVCLGKAVNGEIIIRNLASMPHLLVAGATGAGKSVGLNAIITSLLYAKHPDDLKFVMIDPKMLELGLYNKLENHHLAFSSALDEKVVTNPENAVAILSAVVAEMERRYKYLANVSVRNIKEYNTKVAGTLKEPNDPESEKHEKIPYIVVVIDELADLMITAGKEIEEPIARLTQMARAVGIHCVIATQRPSVDVITGVIKANIPTRIAFQTATKIDSRTILDLMGAEQLLGRGDMLFLPPGQAKPIRIQNAFLDTDEIERVLAHIKVQEFSKRLDLPLVEDKDDKSVTRFSSGKSGGNAAQKDELFEDAKVAIVMNGAASISFLQRRLGIGYSRAAKIVDQLEDEGVVGPPNGSNRREILMRLEDLDGFDAKGLDTE